MPRLPNTDAGTGVPVVLVHGLGGFKEGWGRLPEAIVGGGRRALAVDLPGFGEAPPHPGPPTRSHVDGVLDLLERTGPGVLVGHSLGAQTVLSCAARAPRLVRGLVLLGPYVVPRPVRVLPRSLRDLALLPGVGPVLTAPAIALVRRSPARRRRAFLAAVARPERLSAGSPEALLVEEAARRLAHTDVRVLAGWASEGLRRGGLVDCPRVVAPVLSIAGDRDRLVPAHHRSLLAGALPQMRQVVLAKVGHFPHLEDPSGTAAAVDAALRTWSRAGAW
ncbi:MAG: alpha/beta hydrolase [Miltoncostaeaceae bacterium]